jgi:ubiquinone/menaquinone biosynthesis C-methylase UbiE
VSVATHLGIDLADYDRSIRSFIPDYDTMLDVAAAAVPADARLIVDLGVGTGALAERCLSRATRARVVGVDLDEGMMTMAARRLGNRATFVTGSFLRTAIPRCDAVVASLALHHVRTRPAKAAMYRRIKEALKPNGRAIVVDCLPSSQATLARAQHAAWRTHMQRAYSRHACQQYFEAWAREDVYVPIDVELRLMRAAGLQSDVLWRNGAFAVLVGL